MNSKGIFITGTNTDAGKSVISAGLLFALREQLAINAMPVKPLQTGTSTDSQGNLIIPDLDYSINSNNIKLTNEQKQELAPYCYTPACSPHLAARMAKEEISLDELNNKIKKVADKYDFLVIEGAGGLMVPINEKETTVDFIKKINYPVILVVDNVLGCISHALLTIKVLQQYNIKILGFIMNNSRPTQKDEEFLLIDNPISIQQFSGIPLLAEVKYIDSTINNKNVEWKPIKEQFPMLFQTLTEITKQ